MFKKLSLFLVFLLAIASTSFSQWNNVGGTWAFTDENPDTIRGQIHGLAVDGEGKIWVQVWNLIDVAVAEGDTVRGVYAIRVFNPDGTTADLDPIFRIQVGFSEPDTLYPSVIENPRGMRTDHNGDILAIWRDGIMHRIDHKTGEGLNRIDVELGEGDFRFPSAPAVADDGRIFVSTLFPGGPIKVFNPDFTFAGTAVTETNTFARTIMVSRDGNTIYHCGYPSNIITVYNRPNPFSGYDSTGTILNGFATESAAWNPKSDLFWASAGSFENQAEGYTNGTYYGYDIVNDIIVDSLKWEFNNPGDSGERNRAIDFSPDGNTAYYGIFATGGLPIIQRSVQNLVPVNVTLNVDMNVQIQEGNFNPGSGTIEVTGSFNNWTPESMTDSDGDGIYSGTINVIAEDYGSRLFFKFVMNGNPEDNLNPSPYENNNRSHVVTVGNTSYTRFYNDDLGSGIEVTFNFAADMEVEILKGDFTPGTDNIFVGGGIVQDASKDFNITLVQNSSNSNLFEASETIKVFEGDELIHGFGYGDDLEDELTTTTITATDITNGVVDFSRGYNGLTLGDVTEHEVTITFQVDMRDAVNDVTGEAFEAIENVVLAGEAEPLGWPSAGWPDSEQNLVVFLNDSGQDGDLFGNDTLWSATVTFPAYTDMMFEYKYGANWGLPSNGGSNDNEASTGVLHSMTLTKDILSALAVDEWANMSPTDLDSIVTDVEELPLPVPTIYSLEQNYPNPFNPTTNIRFAVPVADKVTLKVYDVLGQEVATLLSEFKNAGTYKVTFDASQLSSGLYVYTVTTGKFVASKKMMLIK